MSFKYYNMGFIKRLFSSDQAHKGPKLEWKVLQDVHQLDDLVTESFERVVVIFKHSTRCSVSKMVLKGFETDFNYSVDKIQPYYLDLLAHRDISNEIASRFSVEHQSPQLIVLKNARVLFAASHENIDAHTLARYV